MIFWLIPEDPDHGLCPPIEGVQVFIDIMQLDNSNKIDMQQLIK
jgi:hypothetical protein